MVHHPGSEKSSSGHHPGLEKSSSSQCVHKRCLNSTAFQGQTVRKAISIDGNVKGLLTNGMSFSSTSSDLPTSNVNQSFDGNVPDHSLQTAKLDKYQIMERQCREALSLNAKLSEELAATRKEMISLTKRLKEYEVRCL